MKNKDLQELLKNYPDDMEVVDIHHESGPYKETLYNIVDEVYPTTLYRSPDSYFYPEQGIGFEAKEILIIT
jgi:hypothetical protein